MTAGGTTVLDPPREWGYAALAAALALFGSFNVLLTGVDVARWETVLGAGFAIASVLLLHLMLRRQLPPVAFALLPMAVLVPQLHSHWATYWHGFMHASMVNEIYLRGGNPENPLMAGQPLLYMHGHHAAIAWLMHWLPLTPTQGFILTDVVSLPVMVWLFDRTVKLVSTDIAVRVFAATLALCAISPLLRGPLAVIVQHDWFGHIFVYRAEQRFIPLMKFVGINNNQLGLMFCAMGLYGLVSLAARRGRQLAAFGWIAAGLVGSGVFYPPCWVSLGACIGAAAAFLFLRGDRSMRVTVVQLAAVAAVASAVVLPSMLGVTSGKSGGSALRVTFAYEHLRLNGAELLVLLLPGAALAWWRRRLLRDWYAAQPLVAGVLLCIAGVSMLVYALVSVPGPSEYKFVHMTVFALSIPLALALVGVYRQRPALALALLALTVLPMTVDLVHQPPADRVVDPVHSVGRELHHDDPAQDALYTWIAHDTPLDAVFVDSYLTIPALGQRQMLVGLDMRRSDGGVKQGDHDGWMITAREFITQTTGVDMQAYLPAFDAARAVLDPHGGAADAAALRSLAVVRSGRPCFVVARRPEVSARLDAAPGFRKVFGNAAANVYELMPSG